MTISMATAGKGVFMLIGGAAAGLLYILLIPFIWIIAAAVILGREAVLAVGRRIERNRAFGWRPGEAYFEGSEKKKTGNDTDDNQEKQ